MNDLFNLSLSHWNCDERIFVPFDVVKKLKPYHCDPIRFLYNCYKNKIGGAILNQSDKMNFSIQIAAFLRALTPIHKGSVLVLAFEDKLGYWYYHLEEQSKWTVKLHLDTNDSEEPCITLLSLSDEKNLKLLHNREFSMVFVDDFESVAKKTTIRKLKGQFKVGLTHRNFVKHPDQKLQWTMLRWTNPKHVGTFESFCEIDNEHLQRFAEPFTQFWQRRTWDFCGDFKKDTDDQIEVYEENVCKWLKARNLQFFGNSKTAAEESKAFKRKTYGKDSKKGKRKVIKRSSSVSRDEEKPEIIDSSNKTFAAPDEIVMENTSGGGSSSSDTIVYEPDDILEEKPVCHQLPSMEVSPIVQSIHDGFCQSPVKKEEIATRRQSDEILSFLFDDNARSCKSEFDVKDDFRSNSSYDKERILSELFDD